VKPNIILNSLIISKLNYNLEIESYFLDKRWLILTKL
jgi:hypothetical protein